MKKEILTYNNHGEKSEFFSLKVIDTEKDLYDFMYKLPSDYREKKGIWRGIPESRFKLFNSLQRENVETHEMNSVQDVINRSIDITGKLEKWNRGVFQRYFDRNYNISSIPLYAALSILQHHGCRTPFLDWTRNPNVALYFATNANNGLPERIISHIKLKEIANLFRKKESIEDYFSIYFMTSEHPYYNFTSKLGYVEYLSKDNENTHVQSKVNSVIEHGGDSYLQELAKADAITELIQNEINKKSSITQNIKCFPIQRIEDSPEIEITHFLNVNYNINAQNGLFILNMDPYRPLEESILHRIKELSDRSKELEIQKAVETHFQNFICYDIHKKFIPKITEALNSSSINITKETMFPDFEKLKNEIKHEKVT